MPPDDVLGQAQLQPKLADLVLEQVAERLDEFEFEVGEEVVAAFPDADGARSTGPNGRPHLDLWEINRRQLVRAGVPPDQIEVLGICTRCTPDTYFSHRALGYPAGRFGAVIGLHADG